MKKFGILLAFIVLAAFAVAAFAASGRQTLDGNGYVIPGAVYDSNLTKATAVTKGSYVNFSTSGKTFMAVSAYDAAGNSKPIKARLGGFATGSETDFHVITSKEFQVDGWSKVGFKNYTGIVNIHTWMK